MPMDSSWTRRWFLRSVAGGMASAGVASAQRGDIRVQGQRATFSFDGGRSLESVAYTFIHRYSWRVTFEEAPNVYPGDWLDVTFTRNKRPPTDGRRLYNPSGGFLEFSYDLGPYGQAPEDPAEVLQTAIEAYHRGGFPGRYELVTVGEYFHIVPTARRDEGGVWEPIQSPLDTIVSLDGRGRITEEIMRELAQLMKQNVVGYRLWMPGNPFFHKGNATPPPRIVERFERVKAREVLRSLIAATGKSLIWYLMCGMRQDKSGTKRYSCALSLRGL